MVCDDADVTWTTLLRMYGVCDAGLIAVCVHVCSEVDLYFAPLDNVFVVRVDNVTGVHTVSIDPVYRYKTHQSDDDADTFHRRVRRHPRNNTLDNDSNSTAGAEPLDKVYELMEKQATEFVTFVTVPHPDMLLIVRGVRNRLVIMLPNTAHQLKVSRFYVVVAGSTNTSYGILYFRQDQPHIDLFVFFSVFFSCFFLFLAACVMLWKVKQVFDRQRTRHRRQIEMQDMASRPFASALVYMPLIQTDSLQDHQQCQRDHQPRLVRLMKSTSQRELQSTDVSRDASTSSFRLSPLAVEPTRNGVAVVATFMVELPCTATAPVRACLGSCLLTPRILHASTSSYHVSAKPTTGAQPRSSVT